MSEESKEFDSNFRSVGETEQAFSDHDEEMFFPEDKENKPLEKKPFSLIGNLLFLLTLGILIGISWLIYLSWCPLDTSTIPGFRQAENAPDLPKIIKQALERDATISLTEEDINRYLAYSLHPRQQGAMSILATNPGVGIKFHGGHKNPNGTTGHGYLEIIIERFTGVDTKQTISLYLTPTQHMDPHNYMALQTTLDFCNDEFLIGGIRIGGTIGQLSVPQGYMYFLLPAYENLLNACLPIVQLIEENGMGIHINDGTIQLSPPQKQSL